MTYRRRHQLVCCLLAVSTLSAVGVVVAESFPRHDLAARREQFQSLVGGLGFGSAVDLSGCSFSFDPRLQAACSQRETPLPGGFFLCSKHVGCATGYRHLPPVGDPAADVNDHAASR